MASRKRPVRAQAHDHTPSIATEPRAKKSRHAPLTLNRALDKCHEWFRQINRQEELAYRDKKRIFEAFDLLAQEKEKEYDDDDSCGYSAFLKEAEEIGGSELIVLLALAIGKAAFRDMKAETKWRLLIRVAKIEYRGSGALRRLVPGF